MPVYNASDYIIDCLNSVFLQTYSTFEVLAINDGSTDNSLEILNKINHKNKSVKEVKNFFYAQKLTSAPITAAEFFEACKNYPIFFAKDNGIA